MEAEKLTAAQMAAMIDHTYLKPIGTDEAISQLCAEAREYGFVCVMVHPSEVKRCVELLRGSTVRVGTVIGFPLGQNTPETKAFETIEAISNGATEIDTVINIRALQKGELSTIRQELTELVSLCKPKDIISKVIIETCYLTDEEKIAACQIAHEVGVDFVKTSTGFGTLGATVEDIKLMRQTVGPVMGVKASGGVRTLSDAIAMIEAGATRIGTSNGVEIIRSIK